MDPLPSTTVVEVAGPAGSFRIGLASALYVGRECTGVAPDQRLIIDDPSVSRLHVELHVDPGGHRVQAIDRSRNGTLLNGAEMPASTPIVLLDGDTLAVGPTTLRLRLDATATLPRLTDCDPAAQAADVTGVATKPTMVAVATSTADVPAEFVARLSSAARLFGGATDRLPGALLMVRWHDADGERQCARFLDFVTLLPDAADVPVEWSFSRP